MVVQVSPPGLDVTAYSVTAAPPSLAGADHEIVAVFWASVAETLFGAVGTVEGVAAAEAGDGSDAPVALVAVNVNV